ncbi:MAG: PEP-CTERM sorting domain-containing protein [Pirellulales bacterium]|nr:PEP-CTERM sorting domain-containing protein [Pirellulales bacterium]
MKRPTALTAIILSAALTATLATPASAELTFGQWALNNGYTPPGPVGWECNATGKGITSADGVSSFTHLRTLELGFNGITSLAAGQFLGLVNLDTLNLEFNEISSVAPYAFEGLTNLTKLRLVSHGISSVDADVFQGLSRLEHLNMALAFASTTGRNRMTLDPGVFRGLPSLKTLDLFDSCIYSLDLTGFNASALAGFDIAWNPVEEVVLTEAILSQNTFDTLMNGSSSWHDDTPGIASRDGVALADFRRADMSGVNQLDTMFFMHDLETLILTDVIFSDSIIAEGYAEVWDLISALDAKKLDALTVNQELYAAMRTDLDAWDAGPGNVLTVVPEPSALALLACVGLALVLRRRRMR